MAVGVVGARPGLCRGPRVEVRRAAVSGGAGRGLVEGTAGAVGGGGGAGLAGVLEPGVLLLLLGVVVVVVGRRLVGRRPVVAGQGRLVALRGRVVPWRRSLARHRPLRRRSLVPGRSSSSVEPLSSVSRRGHVGHPADHHLLPLLGRQRLRPRHVGRPDGRGVVAGHPARDDAGSRGASGVDRPGGRRRRLLQPLRAARHRLRWTSSSSVVRTTRPGSLEGRWGAVVGVVRPLAGRVRPCRPGRPVGPGARRDVGRSAAVHLVAVLLLGVTAGDGVLELRRRLGASIPVGRLEKD